MLNKTITPVSIWTFQHGTEENFAGEDADEDEDLMTAPVTVTLIIGPATLAFPLNEGWSPKLQLQSPQYLISCLTDLTIKNLTKYFTAFFTSGVRPNCEENWLFKLGMAMLPWDMAEAPLPPNC